MSFHSGDSTASSSHDSSSRSRRYDVIRNIAESREMDKLFEQGTTSSPSQFPLGNSRSFAGLRQSDAESGEIQADDVKDEGIVLESTNEIKSHEKGNRLSSLKSSIIGVGESVSQYIPTIPVSPVDKLLRLSGGKSNTWWDRYQRELDKLRIQRHKEFKEKRKQRELANRNANVYPSQRSDTEYRELQINDAQDKEIPLENVSESGTNGRLSGGQTLSREQYLMILKRLKIQRKKNEEYVDEKLEKGEYTKEQADNVRSSIKNAHSANKDWFTKKYVSQFKGQDSSTIGGFGQDATS
jgi:hypothetical protein